MTVQTVTSAKAQELSLLNLKMMIMRKPVGITVPYREVGYKEPTLRELERKLQNLETLVQKLKERLDKQDAEKVQA